MVTGVVNVMVNLAGVVDVVVVCAFKGPMLVTTLAVAPLPLETKIALPASLVVIVPSTAVPYKILKSAVPFAPLFQ